jgi:hypothetical protein
VDSADHLVGWLRVASFALGVAVIIEAMVVRGGAMQYVTGLLLVGIVPPEAVWGRIARKMNGEGEAGKPSPPSPAEPFDQDDHG